MNAWVHKHLDNGEQMSIYLVQIMITCHLAYTLRYIPRAGHRWRTSSGGRFSRSTL